MSSKAFNVQAKSGNKSDSLLIIIEGDLGINQIDQIKSRISSFNFENKELIIELRNIVSFDLSTFQLLYSLKKSLNGKGKKVKITSAMPESINQVLSRSGIGIL